MNNNKKYAAVLLPFIFLLVFFAYSPGFSGPFVFDDVTSITENSIVHIESFTAENIEGVLFGGHTGPLKRPVAVMTFALNYYFDGLEVEGYKIVNVLLHIANMLLVYLLLTYLFQFKGVGKNQGDSSLSGNQLIHQPNNYYGVFFAVCVAVVWGAHPLHVSGVSYVVQRMNLLASFFCLLSMLLYVKYRIRGSQDVLANMGFLGGISICILLAGFSKENGLLAVVFLFLIEFVFFDFSESSKIQRVFIGSFFLFGLFIPLGVFLYALSTTDYLVNSYASREFTLYERVLSQPRIIVEYIYWLLIPDIRNYGLFHDDLLFQKTFVKPISTYASIIFISIALILSLIFRKKNRLICFGVLFYFAGHLMESTILSLELVYEHRNYLPSVGIVIAIIGGLSYFNFTMRNVMVGILSILLLTQTYDRNETWSSEGALREAMAANHPNSARSVETYNAWKLREVGVEKPGSDGFRKMHADLLRVRELTTSQIGSEYILIMMFSYTNKTIEEEWLQSAVHKLATGGYYGINISYLEGIARCHQDNVCQFDGGYVDDMYNAIISNERNPKSLRSVAAANYSLYLYRRDANLSKLFKGLLSATKIAPKDYKVNSMLVDALIEFGYRDKAEEGIKYLESIDSHYIYSAKIDRYRKRLLQPEHR